MRHSWKLTPLENTIKNKLKYKHILIYSIFNEEGIIFYGIIEYKNGYWAVFLCVL